MDFLGTDILVGLEYIGAVYAGFVIVYILNMFGGIIINCQITKKEKFQFSKILLSFEKIIFCGITLAGLMVGANLVSQGLLNIDSAMQEMVTSVISIGVFALVFAKGFIQKALDLVAKIKYLFEIQDTSKQPDMEKINSMTLEELVADPELNNDGTTPLG